MLPLPVILSPGVAIEWYEAVAVVQEVADRVCGQLAGHSVPELHDIQLGVNGHIAVTGAATTTEPVRRMGQLLQVALAQSEPPVQLRLLVTQATASEPVFGSVRDYSDALAYFERPGRAEVLKSLYDRAVLVPISVEPDTLSLDALVPLEPRDATAATQDAQPKTAALSKVKSLAALSTAVLLVVAAASYYTFVGATPNAHTVTSMAVKASDTVGTAVVTGISAVSERVGLGRLAPSNPSAPATTPSKVALPSSKGAAGRTVDSVKSTKLPQIQVFDLGAEISAASAVIAGVTDRPASVPVPVPPAVMADGAVYSTADPEVVAPVGVRPQLPRVLPADINKEQLSQIELLILPDGTVASVKLLGAPHSVHESMLLSAAKAWQFQPALKDGRPVAYRKTVWLVLQ